MMIKVMQLVDMEQQIITVHIVEPHGKLGAML